MGRIETAKMAGEVGRRAIDGHATTGEYSSTDVSALTAVDALMR